MTFKSGPINYAGDPGYDGIVVIMPKGGMAEQFARTDGKRIGYGQATPEEAMTIELVEGRLPATRVQQRRYIEYWKSYKDMPEPEPAKPEPPKGGWMAMWKSAVDRLLGR